MLKIQSKQLSLVLTMLTVATSFIDGFAPKHFGVSRVNPKPSTLEYKSSAFVLDSNSQTERILQESRGPQLLNSDASSKSVSHQDKSTDPSNIEFVSSTEIQQETEPLTLEESDSINAVSPYPFAAMLQVSGQYIANHAGETVVFHIPGDLIETKEFPKLIEDISLAWLLGMKIVIVVACRTQSDDSCVMSDFDHPHECHNSLRVTGDSVARQVEEEAGFVRFELERLLNRCLKRQRGLSPSREGGMGHVVGGNYYSARQYGTVGGKDYKHTGYAHLVHNENIHSALEEDDVVVLTTIAPAANGDLVTVNGDHLAAAVASSLGAHKLIYMSNEGKGTLLKEKGEDTLLQNIPLSLAQSVLDYHDISVHNPGFATFENARQNLEPGAVELLLLLGWASWAVERGVTRAHIVNTGDGSLLEELFTSSHGTNTCLYHDIEDEEEEEDEMGLDSSELDSFLAAAAATSQRT